MGVWHLTAEQIRESEETQEPLKLGKPDDVMQPFCGTCKHPWQYAKDTPCRA